MKSQHFIAIDLGASGGRVMCCTLADDRFALTELHRFEHTPVYVPDAGDGRWCWDVLHLWSQIKRGLRAAAALNEPIAGIGIDSWGVDYALVDAEGRLVHQPTAYRDPRTDHTYQPTIDQLGKATIYARTGIQFMPLNTLYQLAADGRDGQRPLQRAAHLLMIPQLLGYWLTGVVQAEHTLASTTQLYDGDAGAWVHEFADALRVPRGILPAAAQPGTRVGTLRPEVAQELGLPIETPVFAVGSHDTASAVAAVPFENPAAEAYISSGTWSLVGVELDGSRRTPEALAANFTNEAGVAATTRFLKNITGLWLIQECRRCWADAGHQLDFATIAKHAADAQPLRSVVDPDDPRFAQPGDMPGRIAQACREKGEPAPQAVGEFARCVFDSLALAAARALDTLETLTDRRITTVRIVGGGANNALLNQLIATASGRAVTAGPTEATALGNALVQALAAGALPDLPTARAAVGRSIDLARFAPDASMRSAYAAARPRLD